jgi:glycosyltransferase involved in cell wall biosynthesis
MRRVLIVTGSYAPAMIADMHRARQLAWELPQLGWDVEIFHPDESYQPASCIDPDGAGFFPTGTPVHPVRPHLTSLFRALRIGGIGPRAILPAWRSGQTVLRTGRFDLVYISTAQSLLFLLGPAWRRALGIPFVLDFHDPMFREHADAAPGWRNLLDRKLSRYVEQTAVTAAAGIVSVSRRYIDDLRRRYSQGAPVWLAPSRTAVIPFAFSPRDLAETTRTMPPSAERTIASIVYVGTGGPIMARSFDLLCRALAHLRARGPDLAARVRIELHGTASAVGHDAHRYLLDIARRHGVGDMVAEEPVRVTYRRSVELLLRADGALILGVDDAGYMPSKLFLYAASGKPLLALLQRDSAAFSAFQQDPRLGHAVWFGDNDELPIADVAGTVDAFLKDVVARRTHDRGAALAGHEAAAMAQRHVELFEACLRS